MPVTPRFRRSADSATRGSSTSSGSGEKCVCTRSRRSRSRWRSTSWRSTSWGCRARTDCHAERAMALTLTTHDTGYADPDEPTIAQVLAPLDGRPRRSVRARLRPGLRERRRWVLGRVSGGLTRPALPEPEWRAAAGANHRDLRAVCARGRRLARRPRLGAHLLRSAEDALVRDVG